MIDADKIFLFLSIQVGMEVAPQLKESLNKNFFDFLLTFKQVSKWGFYLQNHINTLLNQTTAYFLKSFKFLNLDLGMFLYLDIPWEILHTFS